jgi:hypothetical protein
MEEGLPHEQNFPKVWLRGAMDGQIAPIALLVATA